MPLFYPSSTGLATTTLTPWILITGDPTGSSNAAVVAGTAYFMPIMNTGTCTATAMRWRCTGTPTGTSDVGIYDASGNLLGHTGAITNISQIMSANLLVSVSVPLGKIYLAFQASAADTFAIGSQPVSFGLALSVAAASVLPGTTAGAAQSNKQPYVEAILTGGFA